jgi:hypothetical protein
MAKPASTIFLPTLWAARCVPFTMTAERDATVFRITLSVKGNGSEGEVVIGESIRVTLGTFAKKPAR